MTISPAAAIIRDALANGAHYVPAPDDSAPLPLVPELEAPAPYPIEALGDILGGAAAAIAHKVQAPESLAAQSVLAAASLAAQPHANVRMPYGQTRPLSCYLVSVAGSGDRKTTADNEALRPFRERENELAQQYAGDIEEWRIQNSAWDAEKKKIEADKKIGMDARVTVLRELGPAPPRPLEPILTDAAPTIEGLIKNWPDMHASLGLFSSEGGTFTGGHGMSPDHKLKTAASLSELWDGRAPRRIRAGDGVTILNGRRLALHMMLQPAVALQFLSDPVLRDQGLLSRVLIAAPASIAGTRLYRAHSIEDDAAIGVYHGRILDLLERPPTLAKGTRNELDPRTLGWSADAETVWRQFYNHVEGNQGPTGELHPIRDFASKAAEHAARIAGVLAICDDVTVAEIDAATMARAIAVADWHVGEAARLAAHCMTDPEIARAVKLLSWIRERDADELTEKGVTVRDVMRGAPADLRSKKAASAALAILTDHKWLERQDAAGNARSARWRLAKGAMQ